MSQTGDKERLLADVLADESAAGFREELLSETLGLVRRRRRTRQAWWAVSGLALLAGLGVLVWRAPLPSPVAPPTGERGYAVVRSRPLPTQALVVTQPLAPSRIVGSVSTAEVVLTAASRGNVHEIDDGGLLALLGSRPAALIRLAPHLAELVFVNPEDEEELVRN